MAEEIIRRPDYASGPLTSEEEAQMKEHTAKWQKIALQTGPCDPEKVTQVIQDLYVAAGLKKPRVVIVPSPLVMAIAGGIAAVILWINENEDKFREANRAAGPSQLPGSGAGAVHSDLFDKYTLSIWSAVRGAIGPIDIPADSQNAGGAAIRRALSVALDEYTPREVVEDATGELLIYQMMLKCIQSWSNYYQGGNMWATWPCYLTAFRDVLGLRLPEYEKLKFWEEAAKYSSLRLTHRDFCIVSDFNTEIHTDDQNRPHSLTGPSHSWSDGWGVYYVHGVRIPNQKSFIVTNPEKITVEMIDKESNQEIKRVMLERMGVANYIQKSNAEVLDTDTDAYGLPRTLYRKVIPGTDRQIVVVHVKNSTCEDKHLCPDLAQKKGSHNLANHKDYFLEVRADGRPLLREPSGRVIVIDKPQVPLTVHKAVASTFGMTGDEYLPLVES